MIALENVSILTPGIRRREPVLMDATATFEPGERVGILAAPSTGKSSIARLLSGIDGPDRGRVRRDGPVSWPIGFAGFLHPYLTVRDNLGIYAKLVGMAPQAVMEFCIDFCRIDGLHRKKMSDLTPTQRALLAYACVMSKPGRAMWIADEVITVGEPRDREACDAVLSERLEDGGLVFLSRNARQLKLYCNRFLVLINRRLVPCDDLEIAREALDRSTAATPYPGAKSEDG